MVTPLTGAVILYVYGVLFTPAVTSGEKKSVWRRMAG
jgi:hypothetical protein